MSVFQLNFCLSKLLKYGSIPIIVGQVLHQEFCGRLKALTLLPMKIELQYNEFCNKCIHQKSNILIRKIGTRFKKFKQISRNRQKSNFL